MNAIDQSARFKDNAGTPTSGLRALGLKRVLYVAVALAVIVAAAYVGVKYWTVWRLEESTDDAYVQADIVPIAPQVAGYIETVAVNDNQAVKAGDVLATIDPRGYQDALDQAKANVSESEAAIATITAELSEQNALIAEAQANLQNDQAAAVYAQQNNQRFGALQKSGFDSVQHAEQAASLAESTGAIVTKDKAALDATKKRVDILNGQLSEAKATVEQSRATLAQAQLNLGYTTLRAPTDGVVGSWMARVGLYAQPGSQLMAIVPTEAAYIVANFKETQLANIKPGQPVTIEVDTFSDTPVRGSVNSVSPASGQEFSLLPPDNATGNFTKIVQRIPVKISIDKSDPLAGRLLPGMSVTATVKVGPGDSSPVAVQK